MTSSRSSRRDVPSAGTADQAKGPFPSGPDRGEEALPLDLQLCFALYACSKEVTRLYRPILQELGITYTQYVTLLALWERDGLPVKGLGSRLYLDSGTLTPLLKKLEAAGLVNRVRDGADERVLRVYLTEAGRALQRQAADIPRALCCVPGIDLQELEDLRVRLQSLHGRIHQQVKEEDSDGDRHES
ncbi:MarR family transcriptional regulator [Paenibacillus albicereus]|uniref:MarR family transcriptional regulator n=1 Tax=Paenibacillus albicereus TaxID=2726185 RepID=A0A6H2H2H7_9BACL|nr:MarR family transcriptional regulator [Paenibacillus albicereus]QJC53881.1 MarR family transcriptional regulator [Paenibacillus albicereus]